MKEVPGVTIDDVSTRDIDDAIWVEKSGDDWTVLVSIADVARAVLPGSEDDLRAHEMVATKYFARGNSPMLPRNLSEEELSLWPHRPRRTITAEIHLRPDLSVSSFSLYRSRLVSQAKLSYRMIPDIVRTVTIHSMTAEEPAAAQPIPRHPGHYDVVRLAADLAMRLLDKRRQNGAMALYDLNNGWITTEEGWLRQLEDHRDAIGQILVQEMMILANAAVARWAIENDLPVPFRNHTARPAAPARAELVRQLDEAMRTPVVDIDVVRQRIHMLLDKADYGVAVQGHFGLNLPAYLHFTSPIRRYADLVAHRQIRAKLKNEPLPYTREQVGEICLHIKAVLFADDMDFKQRAKEKATDRARRVTGARQLAGMYAKDFERVCKTWARDAEDTPEELVQAFRMRIADGTVPPICMAVAFAEASPVPAWQEIQRMLIQHFASKPQDATTVLTIATQSGFWAAPALTTEQSGPPHVPVFRTTASWSRPDGDPIELVHHGATSKKRVEQEAAVLLLAKRFEMPAPEFGTAAPPAAAPAPPPRKAFVFDMTRDPISLLMEYCQAQRIEPATYSFEQQGPAHVPVITCTARCAGKQSTGRAQVKQDAKRAAALALIHQLAPSSNAWPPTPTEGP